VGLVGRRLKWMRPGRRRNRGMHWECVILDDRHDGERGEIEDAQCYGVAS
jgi:hypothetical protein